MPRHLFNLGSVIATQAAMEVLENAGVFFLIPVARHAQGDFGQIHSDKAEMNWQAIKNDDRVFSSYRIGNHDVWVVTEPDCGRTVVRLPFEA